jgi:hypothetical protein
LAGAYLQIPAYGITAPGSSVDAQSVARRVLHWFMMFIVQTFRFLCNQQMNGFSTIRGGGSCQPGNGVQTAPRSSTVADYGGSTF